MDLHYKKNLGNKDRLIRVFIGLVFVGLAILQYISGGWAIVAVSFALAQFVETYFSY